MEPDVAHETATSSNCDNQQVAPGRKSTAIIFIMSNEVTSKIFNILSFEVVARRWPSLDKTIDWMGPKWAYPEERTNSLEKKKNENMKERKKERKKQMYF